MGRVVLVIRSSMIANWNLQKLHTYASPTLGDGTCYSFCCYGKGMVPRILKKELLVWETGGC